MRNYKGCSKIPLLAPRLSLPFQHLFREPFGYQWRDKEGCHG
jgi:hypothetical protein